MATVRKRGDSYAVRFYLANRQRLEVGLGRIRKRDAESAASHIQALVNSTIGGRTPDAEAASWAFAQSPRVQQKLAEHGLIAEYEAPVQLGLSEFFNSGIQRNTVADSTKKTEKRAKNKALEFFGEVQITGLTTLDCLKFQDWLLEEVSLATCRKTISICKRFFKNALRSNWVTENPFDDERLKVTVPAREKVYVELSWLHEAVEAVDSTNWSLILVLARVAGLRVQSEAPLLKWSHIDWQRNRFTVTSPKTHSQRDVPLFPEVRKSLEKMSASENRNEFVLGDLRKKSSNWRTPLTKTLKKAGIKVPSALFNTLRSSAANDICRDFGIQNVSAWVGHTPEVSMKHYLRSTDNDFAKAAGLPAK